MNNSLPQRLRVIDSHTGGEPTRVIVDAPEALRSGTLAERRLRFAAEFDLLRSAVVNEPRGSDVVVGALLCPPHEPGCDAGVIFFNNVGVLQMCVHGTIGLAVTLAYLGRAGSGTLRFDTPVGTVGAELDGNHVTVRNVPSYRYRHAVPVDVPGLGTVHGDIAWGGNWFFLVDDHKQELRHAAAEQLTAVARRIRDALNAAGLRGEDGGEIDHVELFGPPADPANHSRNFVLCPGNAYDRSPCGTGTSAKLACLHAAGKLQPGQIWRQESIVGSVFEGRVEPLEKGVIPVVRGSAYITADATLLLDPQDPFRAGLRP